MMRDVMVREGLSHEEATRRFWALGSRGLLVDDNPRLRDFQVPYARPAAEVAGWSADGRTVGLADVVAKRPPDHADRHLDPDRGVHRGPRPRHGRAHPPADHHAAVQPDLEGRGAARRRAHLDRRPGPGRHRQPVRPGRARRHHLPHRPGQQRPGLPRPRPGRDRGAGIPDHRPHDRRGRRRRRRPVRRHAPGRAAAPGHVRPARRSPPPSPSPSPRPPWPRASPSSRSTTRSSRSTRPCGGPSTRGWRPSRSTSRLIV